MILNKLSRYLVSIVLSIVLFPLAAHALPGDIDGSGRVDGYDLIMFGRANGSTGADSNWNPDADLDADGVVDTADLGILSAHFGKNGISFGLWVGDNYSGGKRVSRISPAGNLLARIGSFSTPLSISSNMSDGTVWVADSYDDKVVKLSPVDGTPLITVGGIDAYSVSVNSKDGSVWIADYYRDRVIKLLPSVPDGYDIS